MPKLKECPRCQSTHISEYIAPHTRFQYRCDNCFEAVKESATSFLAGRYAHLYSFNIPDSRFGSKEAEPMPRPVKVEDFIACPECGSADVEEHGGAFEIGYFYCKDNCTGKARKFLYRHIKPWMRPQPNCAALPGGACCNACFTKYCAFHDSASYTQTKSGKWYYKPAKPSAEEVAADEASYQATMRRCGLITDNEARKAAGFLPSSPDDHMDVTHRATESTKPQLRPPRKIVEGQLPIQPALPAPKFEQKPGGTPTEKSWSGGTQGVPTWGKVLVLMIITAVVAYFVDWGLDWIRSL